MKYIITELFFGKGGGVVFNTALNVEIFDQYVSALRYLVKERRTSKIVDDETDVKWYNDRFGLGRHNMVELIEFHHMGYTIITLAKINENGFH